MSEDETEHDVVCTDCETVPILRETPYRDNTNYVVTCECDQRDVDVSDSVGSSTLTEPVTGKWSNIDHNTRMYSNENPNS